MSRYAEQQRRTLVFVVLFFILLTGTIGAVGYKLYRDYEAQSYADTERWLTTVANSKADAVRVWHTNLLDYAGLIQEDREFSNSVAAYLQDPQDVDASARILDKLQAYQHRDEIDGVELLNPQGESLFALPAEISAPAVLQKIPEARQTNRIVFSDLYSGANATQVHLAVLVPVANNNLVSAFIVLQTDPQVRLYPTLAKEITDEPAIQAFLVRRQGNKAVILSPTPFNPDAALSLQIPIEQSKTLEVRAALGQTGIVEAADYLGVQVLADIRAAPQGWILVTQTSMKEMRNSIAVYFGRTVVVTGTVVFYSGLGLALIWRQQLLKRYKAESEAAQQRATELDEKVRERTAELSALSKQMADLHEKQIENLAQELHDGVGQNLTAINLNLTLLNELLPADSSPVTKSRLADTSQLVEETVARMRNVMADFLPPMLEHYGLTAALEWYGQQFAERTNVQAIVRDLRAEGDRLPPQTELGLFRIAQEALNNVARHAKATRVEIELSQDEESMRMTISDNGIGFEPQEALTKKAHWGLAIMRERARALDATFEIQSAPGAGVKILLQMARST